jgi:hypothetical protein
METAGVKCLKITYDLDSRWGDLHPESDSYLVTIGAKGIGSIYHVVAAHKVKQKANTDFSRYTLSVLPASELKPFAYLHEVENDEPTPYIVINGSPVWAWSLYWNKR